jgi:CheY-like chemotaxis protein
MTCLRILIVEDDVLIGELVGEMLEEMGHTICAIETSEATAVRAAAKHRPDLMIVDARLGEGSGIDAVATILKSGFIPHLFVSGNIAKVRALRPDAILLEKPFHEPELAVANAQAMATTQLVGLG